MIRTQLYGLKSDGTYIPVTVDSSGKIQNAGEITIGEVTGPLTDTELRAEPVEVTGTVATTGGLTNAQLRATAVPVSLTGVATDAKLDDIIEALGSLETLLTTISGQLPAALTVGGNLKVEESGA